MIDAVIFDLDGTLIDSEGCAVEAFEEAFIECGGSGRAPAAAFLALAGRPFEQICVELGLPPGLPAAFRAASRRRQRRLQVVPGMLEILNDLTAAGIPMAVLTGKDRGRTVEILAMLDLARFFQAVATPDDPPAPKPSGDGVLWLCEQLAVAPGRTMVVGDAQADLHAGRQAGATVVACTWGAGTRAALEAEKPDHLVTTVAGLGAVIGGCLCPGTVRRVPAPTGGG